jgi:hypothetical protein|nr:MAG TPA: hypothetical protein [Caudoviricetes sp.]
MGKLDEVFNELNNNIETQKKLADEIRVCQEKLESLQRDYYGISSTPLDDVVNLVKTYDNSKKELHDIGIFLASYDDLELRKLCGDVLRDDMDISKISKICDAISDTISDIIPYPFLYVIGNSTAYTPKYAMLDINIRSAQDYEKVEKVCRMISVLELLQAYLSGLFAFKGGTIEYYQDLLPDNEC